MRGEHYTWTQRGCAGQTRSFSGTPFGCSCMDEVILMYSPPKPTLYEFTWVFEVGYKGGKDTS